MSLLARLLRLYALALACGALYYAGRPPRPRRLFEVWPQAHGRRHRCAACGQARWGEDLGVVPLTCGGAALICDACLAVRA